MASLVFLGIVVAVTGIVLGAYLKISFTISREDRSGSIAGVAPMGGHRPARRPRRRRARSGGEGRPRDDPLRSGAVPPRDNSYRSSAGPGRSFGTSPELITNWFRSAGSTVNVTRNGVGPSSLAA
jgi:hypothetical protein